LVEVLSSSFPDLEAKSDAAFASGDLLDLGAHDPLIRIRNVIGEDRTADIAQQTREELEAAIAAAERAGAPAPTTIFENVYAGLPAHLAAQERTLRTREGAAPSSSPSAAPRGVTGG